MDAYQVLDDAALRDLQCDITHGPYGNGDRISQHRLFFAHSGRNEDNLACQVQGFDHGPDPPKKGTGIIEMDKQKHECVDEPQEHEKPSCDQDAFRAYH